MENYHNKIEFIFEQSVICELMGILSLHLRRCFVHSDSLGNRGYLFSCED